MLYTKENLERRRKKVETSKNIIAIITYIILIPIILYNIIIIIKAANNSEEIPSVFGIKTFVIISGSMEPKLNIGDIVIIKKVEENELQENDIISFRSGESVITHRINKIIIEDTGKIKYETKGDNNNTADRTFVKFEDIEGKQINKIPYIGNVTLLLKNKIIIIIILLVMYIVYWHNMNIENRKMLRREKRIALKDKYKNK